MTLARALACALALALPACDGCSSQEAGPDLGAQRPSAAAAEPESAPLTPVRRADAHSRAVPEARERASRRATLLGDGRKHGRAGRHAEALRSFEDALGDAEGPDAALHCEAGFQAIRLGQWPLARRHLDAGLTVAIQPRRRAACLYNLALVDEAERDLGAAIAALRESLALRPNATVERKLHALEAEAAEAESEAAVADTREAPEAEADDDRPPTLEALCADPECEREEVEMPARPDGWPELVFVTRQTPDEPMLETWLVAGDDSGWSDIEIVASTDVRDRYGALEAAEEITGVRFEDGRLIVAVAGGFDEHAEEAERYFACEEENPEGHDQVMDCFREATVDLPPPESWSFELVFALDGGAPALAERRAGNATQLATEE